MITNVKIFLKSEAFASDFLENVNELLPKYYYIGSKPDLSVLYVTVIDIYVYMYA